jgi:hypothetical protein
VGARMTDRCREPLKRSGRTAGRSERGRAAAFAGALLTVLALVATGCSDEPLASGGALLVAGETLEVADGDDTWSAVSVGANLPEGARVRTGAEEARLEVRGGEVWLAPSTMAVLAADVVEVVRGDALVASGGALRARWGELEVVGVAVVRLTSGVTPLVKVYDGAVAVARHGEERNVPALRQLGLGSVRLPLQPVPIAYDADDPWDARLLTRAVAFDAEVERLAKGIDREHGARPREPEFYETFAAVEPDTIPLLAATSRVRSGDGRFGPPSDALVTLFVAEAVAARNGGDVADTARQVAELRTAGARWGAVAVEHGISTVELARVVDLAQDRRLAVAPPEPPAAPPPAPAATPTERAGGAPAPAVPAAPTGPAQSSPAAADPAPAPSDERTGQRPPPSAEPREESEPQPTPEGPLPAPQPPLVGDSLSLRGAVDAVVETVVEDVLGGLGALVGD